MTDYAKLGIVYDPPSVRVERMMEALPIIRDLLDGRRITHKGRYYRFTDASSLPRPVQKPPPPMVIGGGSRPLVNLEAQFADIVRVRTILGATRPGGDPPTVHLDPAAAP